jgi:integrase
LFWSATEGLGYPFGPLFRLLLVSGQRLNEVGRLEWRELDLQNKVWTLPKERVKNSKEHRVPLSDLALGILGSLPRFKGYQYVFTTRGDRPVVAYQYPKAMVEKKMGINDWVLHDLRRTVATNMARLGVQLTVVEAILNHSSGTRSGVAGIYYRWTYEDQKIEAMNTWSAKLEELIA